MPIKIKYGAVGALGRAAVSAGRAQASQAQAARDIQLTSMAMAAQSQKWGIEAREREGLANRAFAMQQAASTGVARRPVTGEGVQTRQSLMTAYDVAAKSGNYSPAQLKAMELNVITGNKTGFYTVANKPIQPTTARRQRGEEEAALVDQFAGQMTAVDQELKAAEGKIAAEFGTDSLAYFDADPELVKLLPRPGDRELIANRKMLLDKKAELEQYYAEKVAGTRAGVSLADQLKADQSEKVRLQRAAITGAKERVDTQIDFLMIRARGQQKILDSPDSTEGERTAAGAQILDLQMRADNLHIYGSEFRPATDAEKTQALEEANGNITRAREILAKHRLRD